MRGLRKLPELVESIYDAGLDPSLWNNAVAGIRDFVGGQACGLFSKDSISKFGVTHYYCGADPRYIQLYSETYSKFDPLTVLPPHGEIVSIPDLVNFDEYRKGRFYQEWMQPQGCSDAANVVLETSHASSAVMMTVLSDRRMVDPAMKHRLSLIVPHASRALLINRAITSQLTLATALVDVLDNLASGIFLLDAFCRVVHANSAGHALFAAADVVRSVAGQLVTSSAEANQTLREALATRSEIACLLHGAMRSRCFRRAASAMSRMFCRCHPCCETEASGRSMPPVRCSCARCRLAGSPMAS